MTANSSYDRKSRKHACPCCGYATLNDRGGFEICQVCFWEDDGQDSHNADENLGGPNGTSLTVARRNFLILGASDPRSREHVRAPRWGERRLRIFELVDDRVAERTHDT
jgi:hypothetical protein